MVKSLVAIQFIVMLASIRVVTAVGVNVMTDTDDTAEQFESLDEQISLDGHIAMSPRAFIAMYVPDYAQDTAINLLLAWREAAQARARQEAKTIAGKTVEFQHTAVNGDMHLFINGDHNPVVCPECIQPGILVDNAVNELLTKKGGTK